MYRWNDYDDERDGKTCPECIRVLFLVLEVIASIMLAIVGIIIYIKVYYSYEYPNTILE